MKILLKALVIIFLLSSCSKNDDSDSTLVGEWIMTRLTSTFPKDTYPGEIPTVYIFNAGNEGVIKFADGRDIDQRFSYTLGSNNKTLTITYSDSEPVEYTINRLLDNELVIFMRETTMEFEKR